MRHVFPGAVLWVLSTITLSVALANPNAERAAEKQATAQKILQTLSGGHSVAAEFDLDLNPSTTDGNEASSNSNSNSIPFATQQVLIFGTDEASAAAQALTVESAPNSDKAQSDPALNVETAQQLDTADVSDTVNQQYQEPAELSSAEELSLISEEAELTPVAELQTDVLAPILEELPRMEAVQPTAEAEADQLFPVAELDQDYELMNVELAANKDENAESEANADNGHFFQPPAPDQHFSIEVFGWAPLTDDIELPDDKLLSQPQLASDSDVEDSVSDNASIIAEPNPASTRDSNPAPTQRNVKGGGVGLWIFIGACCLAIFLGLRWLHHNLFNRSLFA